MMSCSRLFRSTGWSTALQIGTIVLVGLYSLANVPASQAQMYKVYWKNLQLNHAQGVPNASQHAYKLSGTFLVTDVPATSWNDNIPLLNSGGESFTAALEEVFMEVEATWRSDTNEAVERIKLTYEGGIQGVMESGFKCSKDPFLTGAKCIVTQTSIRCDVANKQVQMGNGVVQEIYPYFDLSGLVLGGQKPLTGGKVNVATATQLSAAGAANGATPPPPPPAATTNLKVTGTWLANQGQINLEQDGVALLGTYAAKDDSVYLVKGTISGERINLTFSISGVVHYYIENLQQDHHSASLNGRIRNARNESGLTSSFQMNPKLAYIPMTSKKPDKILHLPKNLLNPGANGSPVPAHNIAGSWTSVLGEVNLTQNENTVTGELRFSNGIIANLHGTIVNSDYKFEWGINGQNLGTGNLSLSNDRKSLNGSYVDNRVGTPMNLQMTRK